jgi:hypothetical protein
MIDFNDEFAGHGGTFEVRKGKRVLVSMTSPVKPAADVPPPSSPDVAPEPPNAAEGSV